MLYPIIEQKTKCYWFQASEFIKYCINLCVIYNVSYIVCLTQQFGEGILLVRLLQ